MGKKLLKSEISEELIQNIASLARLDIEPSELSFYKRELTKIISYVDCLNLCPAAKGETEDIFAKFEAFERSDVVNEQFDAETMLKNAPKLVGTSFKVPKIIE